MFLHIGHVKVSRTMDDAEAENKLPYLGTDLICCCLDLVPKSDIVKLYRIVKQNRGLFHHYYEQFKREIPHILMISTSQSRFFKLLPSIYITCSLSLTQIVECDIDELPVSTLSTACCSEADVYSKVLALLYVKKILLPFIRRRRLSTILKRSKMTKNCMAIEGFIIAL